MKYTNLDLINQVDAFPHPIYAPTAHAERLSNLTPLTTPSGHTIGYLLPSVLSTLRDTSLSGTHWSITPTSVTLLGDTLKARNANILATISAWRDHKTFAVLSGWRNELYSVYAPAGEVYLIIERAACALFGMVTYGVHLTAYVSSPEGMKIWVPKRNVNKSTYGGMLDNSVAGGMPSGMGALNTLVKESEEEASLPEKLVRKKAKAAGVITYFYVRDKRAGGEHGLLQPEVQYIYDIDVPEDVELKPCDDEVQEFHLWPIEKVRDELAAGNFKPNCNLVLIDFFMRHGFITPENEPDYFEIAARLHRALEFPLAKHALLN